MNFTKLYLQSEFNVSSVTPLVCRWIYCWTNTLSFCNLQVFKSS